MIPAYSHAPDALKTPLKIRFTFGHFPPNDFLFFLRGLGAIVPWCHRGASWVGATAAAAYVRRRRSTDTIWPHISMCYRHRAELQTVWHVGVMISALLGVIEVNNDRRNAHCHSCLSCIDVNRSSCYCNGTDLLYLYIWYKQRKMHEYIYIVLYIYI